MKLHDTNPAGGYHVTGYAPDCIWINEKPYHQSVIITPQEVQLWSLQHLRDFDLEVFLQQLGQFGNQADSCDIDVVLLGVREPNPLSDAAFFQKITAAPIQIDTMNTEAACRTYNILTSEGRSVCAGLML